MLSKFKRKQILKDLTDKQPLPMGVKDFHVWSDRIIAAAMIPADVASQKFALADMILHLGATEDHKEDGYFVKVLRKTAVNQIADFLRKEIRDERKAALEAQERAIKEIQAAQNAAAEVLEHEYVPPASEAVETPSEVTHTPEGAHVLEKGSV